MLSMANDRRLWLVLPMATLLLLGTGCQQHQQRKSTSKPMGAKPTTTKPADPMPTDPDPGPSGPTMMAGSSVAVALPTGDRRTSALLLEKMAPDEVRMGQEYEYVLKVTNLTDMPLNNVQVVETTEGGFTMSGSAPQGRLAGTQATWDLGTLGPRESKTIRVRGRATARGTVEMCASVTWDTAACVQTRVVEPQLKLEKQAPAEALACEEIPMTFIVTNTGDGAARDVVIEDQLPAGMTSEGGQTIRIDAGTLDSGQSRTFRKMVKASRTGSFNNTASASSGGDLTVRSNTTTTVVRQPKLTIECKCPDTIWAGRNATCEVTVRNTGDGPSRDTRIECSASGVPVQFVSASDGGQNAGGRTVWNLGTLEPGATRTLNVTLNPQGKGTFTQTCTANGYCADPVRSECGTDVKGIPAVLLEVIDITDPVQVGTDTTYVITVTNQGSAQDTNVRIVCNLEAAQQLVSATGITQPTSPVNASATSVTFAPLPVLAVGAKESWRVTVKAKSAGDIRFAVQMNTDNLQRPVNETEATNFYE